MASNVVTKSKASGSAVASKSLRSRATNSMFAERCRAASARAAAIASGERSSPVKRLFG